MNLPDHFRSYEDYRNWLDETAENEIDEMLDALDEEIHEASDDYGPEGYIADMAIHDFASECPALADDDWKLARLYDDVAEHTDAQFVKTQILLPYDNPWYKISQAVRETLVEDLYCRMFEMLEQRGYDIE